jgi:hypothetical protein
MRGWEIKIGKVSEVCWERIERMQRRGIAFSPLPKQSSEERETGKSGVTLNHHITASAQDHSTPVAPVEQHDGPSACPSRDESCTAWICPHSNGPRIEMKSLFRDGNSGGQAQERDGGERRPPRRTPGQPVVRPNAWSPHEDEGLFVAPVCKLKWPPAPDPPRPLAFRSHTTGRTTGRPRPSPALGLVPPPHTGRGAPPPGGTAPSGSAST